jgi:hypothetical protein
MLMESRSPRRPACCGDEPCGRAEFVKLVTPDDQMEPYVDRLAREVAGECPVLDSDGLAECFEYVFELSRECVLFDRFCAAYRSKREGMVQAGDKRATNL